VTRRQSQHATLLNALRHCLGSQRVISAFLKKPDHIPDLALGTQVNCYPAAPQSLRRVPADSTRKHRIHILPGYKVPGSRPAGNSLHVCAGIFDCIEFQRLRIDDDII